MVSPLDELTENSLENLTERDLVFLIKSYADQRTDHQNIKRLVKGDADIVGLMVESDRVFHKLMDRSTTIQSLSPYFFFTLLLRRAARELSARPGPIEAAVDEANRRGAAIPWTLERAEGMLADRGVTNYLANMIATFIRSSRLFKVSTQDEQSYYYLVDLIEDCQQSDSARRFWIYCHIGNYSLFLTGLFPEFIHHRYTYRRRPVDEHFYIDFGKTYYGLASDHQIARRTELDSVFVQLSSGFEIVKQFLNYVTKRYLRNSSASAGRTGAYTISVQ